MLKEATKFPKHIFLDGTFDKWLHKTIFWSQVNAYPFEALNSLSLKQLQIDIQHITIWRRGGKFIFCHCHWSFHLASWVWRFVIIIILHSGFWIQTQVWPPKHSGITNFTKEVFPIPNKSLDFGLNFVKQLVFRLYIFFGVDVINFWHQKMESNLALVLFFWCWKFLAIAKTFLVLTFDTKSWRPRAPDF